MSVERDPTSRPRRSHDQELLTAQEIIRRHGAGESVRTTAREVGLPRTSVHRVIAQYRAAQRHQHDVDDELASEAAALLAKYGGGVDAEGFDIADADPVVVSGLVANGVDISDPQSIAVIAALTKDPTNELALYRCGHLPRTAEWWSVRNPLGQLLSEEAEIKTKIAGGWRYHDFGWHAPADAGLAGRVALERDR